MGIATASFNHVVYCNEPEPVLVVVKRVAGHCIVMNCIVSPRYQSPPAYLVAAPRPRSSDGPARCLLTVNKTNFGIINIFVSPSPSSPPLPIKERTMLQFRQCVTIWSWSSENMGRARSIVSIYSFRLSRICHPTIGWSTRSPRSGCGDYLSDGSGRRRVACARPQAPPHNL